MDSAFWDATFSAALQVCRRWSAEQTRSEGLLLAFAEFHSRLQLLVAARSLWEDAHTSSVVFDVVRGSHLRLNVVDSHANG